MPSIYPTLKKSDRKFIAREKGRIRAQFSDVKKQEELISVLYVRFLGKASATDKAVTVEAKTEVKKEAPKEATVVKAKEKKVKATAKK